MHKGLSLPLEFFPLENPELPEKLELAPKKPELPKKLELAPKKLEPFTAKAHEHLNYVPHFFVSLLKSTRNIPC